MGRNLQMLIFPVMMVVVLGVWHGYLWARLVRAPEWSPLASRVLTGLLIFLALSIPAAFIALRTAPRALSLPLGLLAFSWMGIGFYLFVIVGAADLLKLAGGALSWLASWLRPDSPPLLPEDPQRRLMLARAVTGVAVLGAGVAGVGGLRNALGKVALVDQEIRLPGLPPGLDGMTLAQLTDLHIGEILGRPFLADLVERVNGLGADAVVITGDLVDGSVAHLGEAVAPLAGLRSQHGTFFVTGNHEYYSGAPAWESRLRELGLTVLDNQHVELGEGSDRIVLAGVPDPTARMLGPEREPDVARAIAGRAAGLPVVLLAHQPRAIAAAADAGVDLVLSGHTHGGQIWPFGALVLLNQPYLAGLHRHRGSQIYVSRGTGFWGPPLRLGAPAEITRITLRPGAPVPG